MASERPGSVHVGPVIAVGDLDRARDFYENKLGFDGVQTPGGWMLRADDGTVVYLLPEVANAGSADWPVASLRVDDVRAVVREYRDRGVSFLGPDDIPFDLDEDGISKTDAMQVAWFRDPDGSVLTIFALSQDD